MSEAGTLVRELAAWDLDQDDFRPAAYRGNPDSARAVAGRRTPFEARSALVDFGDCGLGKRLAEQESRADLRAEMAELDWSLGVLDLRLLLAFQRRIVLVSESSEIPTPAADDWDGLIRLCIRRPKPVACDAVRGEGSVVLRSKNPNLQFRITDNRSNPIAIHSGSPFFEVAQYQDRWFLRDGYHRAFCCLKSGVIAFRRLLCGPEQSRSSAPCIHGSFLKRYFSRPHRRGFPIFWTMRSSLNTIAFLSSRRLASW